LLKTCFFTNINVNLFNDPWKTTTFIVPKNELQNVINQQMINTNAIESKQKCYITIMATNTLKKSSIQNDIQHLIKQTILVSKTKNLARFLKFYKGMKIIIIKNLYPKLGIVNGTIGYIQNILINESQWIQGDHSMHPPTNVYVILNKFIKKHDSLQDITLEGPPKNVIPIIPISITFQYHHQISK